MNIKNNQKGFVAQGMVIIIAIAVIAGVAYYFGTKKVVAPKGGDVVVNATSTVTDAKCANGATNYPHCNADLPQASTWRTYRSNKYGFELSYPSNFVLQDNGTIEFPYLTIKSRQDSNNNSTVIIGVVTKHAYSYNGDMINFVKSNLFNNKVIYSKLTKIENVKLGELDGVRVVGETEDGMGKRVNIIGIYVINPDQINKLISVTLWNYKSDVSEETIFNEILSSLKFTSNANNSTPSTLTVLSPNGNENWVKGSTKTIRWSNPSTQTVTGVGGPRDEIAIFINSQPTDTAPLLKTIVTGLNKNATSYDWVVGTNAENTVLNGRYYIKVCRQSFTCDWSDAPFTITN